MIINIKNPDKSDGDQGCILFVYSCDDITKSIVIEKLTERIDSIFKNYYCSEIEIWCIRADSLIYHICGCNFDHIHFYDGFYTNDQIMYAMTRLRPQLKPKIKFACNQK